MTIENILDRIDHILALPYIDPDEPRLLDLEELRDEIRRDQILFPEVYT